MKSVCINVKLPHFHIKKRSIHILKSVKTENVVNKLSIGQ